MVDFLMVFTGRWKYHEFPWDSVGPRCSATTNPTFFSDQKWSSKYKMGPKSPVISRGDISPLLASKNSLKPSHIFGHEKRGPCHSMKRTIGSNRPSLNIYIYIFPTCFWARKRTRPDPTWKRQRNIPIPSMGLVNLPIYPIKINHSWSVNIPFVPWMVWDNKEGNCYFTTCPDLSLTALSNTCLLRVLLGGSSQWVQVVSNPIYTPWNGHLETTLLRGRKLIMVINHLHPLGWSFKWGTKSPATKTVGWLIKERCAR